MLDGQIVPGALDDTALDRLFREARTANRWQDRTVTDETLHALYELAKWGPTAANGSPARFLFVRTAEGRELLRPALSAGNLEKTLAAPVVTIVAYDPLFFDSLPKLFPHADARAWYAGKPDAESHAFRNGTLQAAYLILAARAWGLDAGPMSGFDAAKVDAAFLAGTGWKTNMLVSLGHADPAGTKGRLPRLSFEEACRLA